MKIFLYYNSISYQIEKNGVVSNRDGTGTGANFRPAGQPVDRAWPADLVGRPWTGRFETGTGREKSRPVPSLVSIKERKGLYML
jgi:hypothetical protein